MRVDLAMPGWPKYGCHKVVRAAAIVDIVDACGERQIMVKPFGAVHPFAPTNPSLSAGAKIGDYAVIYEDGYRSVSPKAAFEAGYTRSS